MAVKSILIFAVLVTLCVVGVRFVAHQRETAAEAAYPPEGQFIDVGGRQVHVVVEGSGPDLILLHGAGGSTRDLTFQFTGKLSDRYRIITFDRPGMGYTDRADDYGLFSRTAESPRVQARFLQKAAAKLGVSDAIVMGHSFGGAVALAWALESPETTAGLIVLAGASNEWEGGLGSFYNVTSSPLGGAIAVPLATAFAPDSYVDGTIDGIFAPQPVPDGYADYVGPRISARRETLRANGRQVHGLKPYIIAQSQFYPTITAPTEIVHGDIDTIVPLRTHGIPLSKQIEGSVLTVLPGIGHMPQHVAADDVVAAIDRVAERAGLR